MRATLAAAALALACGWTVVSGVARAGAAEEGQRPADPIEDWIEKSRNPVPQFKWGADFRLRDEWVNNVPSLDKHALGHDTNRLRLRPRGWGTITPIKGVDLNGRLLWEGNYFSRPEHTDPKWQPRDVLWDAMNLKLTDLGASGLGATVGRQEIRLGEGWLVADGGPLDGTRTFYFDACRLTYEAKPAATTFDAIFIHQKADPADSWLANLQDKHRLITEQNENGFVFWAANKSLATTEIDGYYIYKQDERVARNGNDADLHTFGGRVAGDLADHWQYRVEGAHQFGEKNGRTLRAFGANNRVAYLVKDARQNQVRADYEFESGNDPGSRTIKAFDPLWGRWTRFSELFPPLAGNEARANEVTNMHRLAIGHAWVPFRKAECSTDYHFLWADENTFGGTAAGRRRGFSADGKFRGQLFQAILRYTFTSHLKGHLWGEWFFPGNYYLDSRNDVASFLRAELVFSY